MPAGAVTDWLVSDPHPAGQAPGERWRSARLEANGTLNLNRLFPARAGQAVHVRASVGPAQGEAGTPVLLDEPGDQPLLGVVTLDVLGMVLSPLTRRLQPMRMVLT